jgi:hypothetical protein
MDQFECMILLNYLINENDFHQEFLFDYLINQLFVNFFENLEVLLDEYYLNLNQLININMINQLIENENLNHLNQVFEYLNIYTNLLANELQHFEQKFSFY